MHEAWDISVAMWGMQGDWGWGWGWGCRGTQAQGWRLSFVVCTCSMMYDVVVAQPVAHLVVHYRQGRALSPLSVAKSCDKRAGIDGGAAFMHPHTSSNFVLRNWRILEE